MLVEVKRVPIIEDIEPSLVESEVDEDMSMTQTANHPRSV